MIAMKKMMDLIKLYVRIHHLFLLGSITQANSGYAGNNDGDVNYENAVDVSQRINQANTCSEFGFGDYGLGASKGTRRNSY